MNLFQWQTLPETDSILGYKCHKAKAEFRGRKYTAWFATDLTFKAAPWKIHGLPGVVLQVQTSDYFLYIKAKTIRIQKANEIVNPDRKEEFMSWKEFEGLYEVKMKQTIAYAMTIVAKIDGETLRGGMPREEILHGWNDPDFDYMNAYYNKRREED